MLAEAAGQPLARCMERAVEVEPEAESNTVQQFSLLPVEVVQAAVVEVEGPQPVLAVLVAVQPELPEVVAYILVALEDRAQPLWREMVGYQLF